MDIHEIEKYMESIKEYHYDSKLGDYNMTYMAEDAADHFDHDEWLDDETHIVWEAAFNVVSSK
jgi:hypothetical protein